MAVDTPVPPAMRAEREERLRQGIRPVEGCEAFKRVLAGHDDFLELGGDSLVAMQLVARLREAFRIDLSLQSVLDAPTMAGLAEMVQACQHDATAE